MVLIAARFLSELDPRFLRSSDLVFFPGGDSFSLSSGSRFLSKRQSPFSF